MVGSTRRGGGFAGRTRLGVACRRAALGATAAAAAILVAQVGAALPGAAASTSRPSGKASSSASAGARPSCQSELHHMGIAKSRPDYALDNEMRSYANSGRGWSGGDGGNSVMLPGGSVAWLFDDSYDARVVGNARPSATMMHNMVVLQQGQSFTTLHRVRRGRELEYMNWRVPPKSRLFFWNNAGVVSDGALYVSYSSYYYPSAPTVFGFVRTGTVLAKLALPSMRIEQVSSIGGPGSIEWGVDMVHHGPWVYIYGSAGRSGVLGSSAYLARAPSGALFGPWQFWDGHGWTAEQASAAAVSSSVSTEFSVVEVGNVYVLVTMGQGYLSPRIMAYFGCALTGPFIRGQLAYTTTGRSGPYGTNGIDGVYTYGACAHPELTKGDQIVISYDVNTSVWSLLNENVNIVRPRYVRATISFGTGTTTG